MSGRKSVSSSSNLPFNDDDPFGNAEQGEATSTPLPGELRTTFFRLLLSSVPQPLRPFAQMIPFFFSSSGSSAVTVPRVVWNVFGRFWSPWLVHRWWLFSPRRTISPAPSLPSFVVHLYDTLTSHLSLLLYWGRISSSVYPPRSSLASCQCPSPARARVGHPLASYVLWLLLPSVLWHHPEYPSNGVF